MPPAAAGPLGATSTESGNALTNPSQVSYLKGVSHLSAGFCHPFPATCGYSARVQLTLGFTPHGFSSVTASFHSQAE